MSFVREAPLSESSADPANLEADQSQHPGGFVPTRDASVDLLPVKPFSMAGRQVAAIPPPYGANQQHYARLA